MQQSTARIEKEGKLSRKSIRRGRISEELARKRGLVRENLTVDIKLLEAQDSVEDVNMQSKLEVNMQSGAVNICSRKQQT